MKAIKFPDEGCLIKRGWRGLSWWKRILTVVICSIPFYPSSAFYYFVIFLK